MLCKEHILLLLCACHVAFLQTAGHCSHDSVCNVCDAPNVFTPVRMSLESRVLSVPRLPFLFWAHPRQREMLIG